MLKILKMLIPSGETKEIEGIETWIVSWTKRIGEFNGDMRQCFQAFTTEDDAKALKKSLDHAHKLIGNTSGARVTIEKQQTGL
jgi:hypothetical protein